MINTEKELIDFMYEGLQNFSYMMSRTIPKQFTKATPIATEKHSVEQGIIAYQECIKILKNQSLSVKPLILPEHDEPESLNQWYKNAIIEFMATTFEFKGFTNKQQCDCGIQAFKRGIKELKGEADGT